MNQSKRDFIKLTGLGILGLDPMVSLLANILKIEERTIADLFSDDFHYFNDNLANLHFYFINAKLTKKRLAKVNKNEQAYMIVKIPQQHVAEQMLKPDDFKTQYMDPSQNVDSRISGFSYLAFVLFPVDGRIFMDVPNMAALLDWSNARLFKLLVPTKENYRTFSASSYCSFKANDETLLTEDTSKKLFDNYATICEKLFIATANVRAFPLTLIEIPEGLVMAPYTEDKNKAFVKTDAIGRERFVYNKSQKVFVKSVQEIWSAEMFFKNAEGTIINPSLRAVGFFDRYKEKPVSQCPPLDKECVVNTVDFLPNVLDKNEIVYLTSLGRQVNEAREWNIEAKGLLFTGLGAIAKLHYKNLNPPIETDLAEYEHHITLGRDEYIKVARIGVISATGQKALHVKIGQRKFVDGHSYIEFNEYIEIVQKEIVYYDPKLFLPADVGSKEPENYIQARKYPPAANQPNAVIHSLDDTARDDDNTYRDNYLWQINDYLPEKWLTNYRRWPFKRIKSITTVSKPIDSSDPDAHLYTAPGCGEFFWPVLSAKVPGKDNDCYMEFAGYDWNDNETLFSTTFLFIRKNIIESTNQLDTLYKILYDDPIKGFKHQKPKRRQIKLSSVIAYTPDYLKEDPKDQEQPNKSNVAKTDYIEYYFSIAAEPNGVLADGSTVMPDSIFNERYFPLFPQVLKSQLYVDNIQSYTPEPLASLVEYNGDYISHGYYGTIVVAKTGQPAKYNKARLVFNHTNKFMSGADQILEEKNGVRQPSASTGYAAIKQVFNGSGSSTGGLVNPDFDIESIGLVKQSIAVAKNINKKYEQSEKFIDEITEFNPSDLLRQAPEIFKGISILDIMLMVFPDFEAPLNEIKKLGNKFEDFKGDLLEHPIYVAVKSDLDAINNKIKKAFEDVEDVKKRIAKTEANIKKYKDQFNSEFFAAEIEKLVESAISQYKIDFLDVTKNGVATLEGKAIDLINKYLATEILSMAESMYSVYPYYEDLHNAYNLLETLKKPFPDPKHPLHVIIDKFKDDFISGKACILINPAEKTKDTIFRTYQEVQDTIKDKVTPYFNSYMAFCNAMTAEQTALDNYTTGQTQFLYAEYLKRKKGVIDAHVSYKKLIEDEIITRVEGLKFIEQLKLNRDYAKISQFEKEIEKIIPLAANVQDLLENFNLPYYINYYEKAIEDYRIFKSKLKESVLTVANPDMIQNIEKAVIGFKANILTDRNALKKHYEDHYDTLRKDFDTLVSGSQDALLLYVQNTGPARIQAILQLTGMPDEFEKCRKAIVKYQDDLEMEIKNQRVFVKEYEKSLRDQVDRFGKDIIENIREKVREKEVELRNNPDVKELATAVAKGHELLNILTAVSRKEINYTWKTSSFKNADFGIVSFIASSDPKTTMEVNVKSAIVFEPMKFPAVIQKVEAFAENKLTNFSIGLLKAIIINFNEVSFVAGTNRSPKFEVKVRDVQFAGAFSFVQALESCFKGLLGDNFNLQIQPTGVQITYQIKIDFIGPPSFGFRDILFMIVYRLNFQKPMEVGVGIGTSENRTKLSVGIYTGLFYFLVVGNPKEGITTIIVSIEFGGYFGLSLGPLRGEVKLVVGLYYQKDPTGVVMAGYFLCEGRVKLWFMMIMARFYMGVRSQGNYVEGRCTVTYEIRISRFFKKSFSATYYKKLAGATPGNNESGNSKRLSKSVDLVSTDNYKNPTKRQVQPLKLDEFTVFMKTYID